MRYVSIKLRITAWFTLLMAVIVILILVFLLVVNGVGMNSDAEYALMHAMEQNIENVDYDNGVLDVDRIKFTRHKVYTSIYNADQELIASAAIFRFDGYDQFQNDVVRQVEINGMDYLVCDLLVQHPMGNLWFRGVTSVNNNWSVVHIITLVALLVFPLLLLIAAVGGWFISKHAFKPITQITDTVDKIADGDDLSARIGLKPGKDEVHKLAATFDRLLDRLEASFDAEKRFASDASHELRTPTAVILAECDYAKDNYDTTEEFRASMEVVERQARRMSSLIAQLLAVTRLDQGTQKTSFERADLSELVDIVCDETAQTGNSSIRLVKTIQPEITADFDVGLISRLVQNLIENAYKYTGDSGVVTVSLTEGGGLATLAVADTGIGIAPENLQKIWRRFWQADPARGEGSGTGLGLSMVKQIAELHDGAVSVESTPGQGSVFTFTMPLARKAAAGEEE